MRDIAITLMVLISLPFILKRPAIGILMWVWVSLMNPHRLAYGFAHDLPFAALIAATTFLGILVTRERRHLPMNGLTITLMLFMFWICVTSTFPIHPGSGFDMWSRVMKILLMTVVAMFVVHKREHVQWMVWVIVVSIGFYGVKGGVFAIATAGSYTVWGPEGTFIGDNNSIALAILMVIPLMRYLQLGLQRRWQRHAMTGAMLLCTAASLSSYSRGALITILAMGAFLWWKSRNKAALGVVLLLVAIAALFAMPDGWFERMNTIKTYDADASAMGRINAWQMAFNLAKDRFLGGGFEIYEPDMFARYAPDPLDIHAAHSIYFQVLGEHGFVGLALFVTLGFLTWRGAAQAKRIAKKLPDAAWVGSLTDMVKVSMVAYAVGGALLSLSYFDLPYYLMVIVVVSREWARAHAKGAADGPVVRPFGRVPASALTEPVPPAALPATTAARPNAFGHGRRPVGGFNR